MKLEWQLIAATSIQYYEKSRKHLIVKISFPQKVPILANQKELV